MPVTSLATATRKYLDTVLGQAVATGLKPWPRAVELPLYLQQRYAFYTLRLLDRPSLLLCALPETEDTPAVLRKHWQAVEKHFNGEVVLALEGISSYNRKRLIEQGVPFIVPGTQLYLPQWGALLSEQFKKQAAPQVEKLSAVAQVLLLRYLLGLDREPQSAMVLAEHLGYSKMTLSRAVKELVAVGLAQIQPAGREKRLWFTLPAEQLWQQAQPYLDSPIQKLVRLSDADTAMMKMVSSDCYRAGESALAEVSLINKPSVPVFAMAAAQWASLERQLPKNPEGDGAVLELWRYDPALLVSANAELVDKLSLYLSLRDTKDERLDIALETLLQDSLK